MPAAQLSWTRSPSDAEGVILVLHGGAEKGERRNTELTPPVLLIGVGNGRSALTHAFRLPDFNILAVDILPVVIRYATRRGNQRGLHQLRFAVIGWNGERQSPVHDARAAIAEISERYPHTPIVVVGHSLGGRTAIHVADEPNVLGIIGLAPWIEPQDPIPTNPAVRVGILHGDRDLITSLRRSRGFVRTLTENGHDASLGRVENSLHGLFPRQKVWMDAAAAYATNVLRSHTDVRFNPTNGKPAVIERIAAFCMPGAVVSI